jgi:hypothetical protein
MSAQNKLSLFIGTGESYKAKRLTVKVIFEYHDLFLLIENMPVFKTNEKSNSKIDSDTRKCSIHYIDG